MNSTKLSLLVSLVCLVGSLPTVSIGEPLPTKQPVVSLNFTTGATKGISNIVWHTDGVATDYDAKSDRLVDGAPGQERPGEFPGNPQGKNRGAILESRACNNLLNSSFENGLAHWLLSSLDAQAAGGGIHGKKMAVLKGTGEIYQRLAGLTPGSAKAIFGCLSVYVHGDAKDLQKVMQPFVCRLDNDKRGQDLIWDVRYLQQPGSKWTRLAACFTIPGESGETFRYEAGLAVTGAADLKIDAAQLEVRGSANAPDARERWVSSYIPTFAERRCRANEYAEVTLRQPLDVRQGTMAVWWHGTNPTPFIYGLLQTKGIQLGGAGVLVGKTWANNRLLVSDQLGTHSFLPTGWHLFTLTWRDGEGEFYVDGKEASVHEGVFKYQDDGLASVNHLILGAPSQGDAEGCISSAAIYSNALSDAEVRQLSGLAPLPPATEKTVGIPVEYTVLSAGKVSVGLYDKQGSLVRQIVMGEPMTAGRHTVYWDGKDDNGRPASAGSYQVRGVVNEITCRYKMGVGNTGVPPWGPSKVCEGNWVAVARSGDKLVAAAPFGEFGRMRQCFTAAGQVVWTKSGMPFGGEQCALAADDQFIYVAGVLTQEYDPAGRLYFSDAVWRLNAKDGSYAPWSGQKDYLRLPTAKRMCPDPRPYPSVSYRYPLYRAQKRWSDPHPWYGVRGLALFAGKLYLSLFHENRILIMDAQAGTVTGEIRGIPQPQGVAVYNGILYVASKDRILKHDLQSGTTSVLASGLSAPYGVAVGPNGDVYITDLGLSQQVKVFNPAGKLKRTIGRKWFGGPYRDGRTDRLFLAFGLAVDGSGNLTVADLGNSRLVHYDAAGRLVRTTEAYGYGGLNGGVQFLPGDASRLLTCNDLNCDNMLNLQMYRLDMAKSTWQTAGRWQDIAPVTTGEPLVVRRLENGRTYLYFGTFADYMTIFELKNNNRLEFCCAFFAPRWEPLSNTLTPAILADAKAAGLVTADGKHFRCRAVWTDHNRDGRMQKDELTLDESWTKDWANINLDVDQQGNMLVQNQLQAGSSSFLLLRNGFDAAGNPRYDWQNTRQVFDQAKQSWIAKEGLYLRAQQMDPPGNLYASFVEGNCCFPTKVRLAKFGPDGRLLWKFGRKSVGFKDKPGEFDSVCDLPGIVDDILYVADYSSPMDLLTTDGLYLTTLLKVGGIVEENQYSYFGENFFSDVVKDQRTGQVFFVINPHCFVLPVFEVLGLDTVKRFRGSDLTLDETALAKVGNIKQEQSLRAEQNSIIYLIDRPITIDGDLADWQGIPAKTTGLADQEDQYNVKYRYACDGKNLLLAFRVKDPTPAINACVTRDGLWRGDCVEFYFGRAPGRSSSWKPGDFVIHLAACPNPPAGKDVAGLTEPGVKGGNWITPPELKTATRIWPDRKGYDLEAAIPLKTLGMDGMPAGTQVLMDFDTTYGSAKTQAEAAQGDFLFKLPRNPRINANQYLDGTARWNCTRVVRVPGEEDTIYARPAQVGWDRIPVQAENEIEGVANQYASTLKVAYDGKGLYFFTAVRDPTPGLVTAGAGFLGTGDWMEVFVDGLDIYAPASAAYKTAYLVKGNQPSGIPGATSTIKIDKASYTLEVFVPWAAVGGKKEKYTFNWRTGWSDVSGGAVFGQRLYRPQNQPTTLVILP